MAQSSIEWLISEFEKQIEFRPNSELDIWFKDLLPKAKAMHELEIIKAHFTAQPFSSTMMHNAENYYNLTFNQDGAEQN